MSDLISHADGMANVLLYSPRRYGKTSLVKRVQAALAEKGVCTFFVDFFGVTSVDDVAARLAKGVFEATKSQEGLFKTALKFITSFRPVLKPDEKGGVSISIEPASSRRGGLEVLEETMASLGEFIKGSRDLVHIALDEFQEIVELKEALQLEGVMRSHIQRQKASYFFIGSRRRILLNIFNERQRPFFQSAINYQLGALPHDELSEFVVKLFVAGGKECRLQSAELISNMVLQHPYYSQKLAFFAYQLSDDEVLEEDISAAYQVLIDSERPVFESIVQGLAPKQIALLKAIAEEPAASIFSIDYMKRHGLGSTGGVQGAVKKLASLDLIEQKACQRWEVVDPILNVWLKRALA